MKICIIGCGNQGGCLAALLAMEKEVTEVVLADMDLDKANDVKRLILSLGEKVSGIKIEVTSVNAKDANDVARAANGAKLVFNGILPFCNVSVMKGALIAGANYMDLYAMSADIPGTPYEETIDAQLELDEEFKKAGLVALPSEGVAPGWVNLVTKTITDEMDTVEEVAIRSITWLEGKKLIAMGPKELSILMTLRLEPSSYYKDGEIIELEGLDNGEDYVFPSPAGSKHIYMESVGCVEAMIRKYTGKSIGKIWHRGGIFGGTSDVKDLVFRAVREQVLKHPNTEEMNLVSVLADSLTSISNADYKKALEIGELTDGADTAVVEVTGTKDGHRIIHKASFISTVHEAIKHIPWAGSAAYGTVGSMPFVLAKMLLRDEIKEKGVIPPAMLSNAERIFADIEAGGHIIAESIEKQAM